MRFFKLTLAYDGSAYAGWQWQPKLPTIQGTLEAALKEVTGETIRAIASGRTDTGVHALGQVVNFQSQTKLPPEVLFKAINANLPADVLVLEVRDAPEGFHAIRDAVGKRYRYVIQDGPLRDLFARAYSWHIRQRLDDQAMRRAAEALMGTHDFASFETAGSQRLTTVRTVRELLVERLFVDLSERVVVEIEADGFLYNMVRNIVGTLVEVGRGRRPESWPAEVLTARDRRLAGMAAPPQGLFLVRVDYDEEGRGEGSGVRVQG
jgi:tRNA pseudouridine38-40 synthase